MRRVNWRRSLATGAGCVFALAGFARGDIVGESGDIEVDNPPRSLERHAWESSDNIRVFSERLAVEITAPVSVELSQPGILYQDRSNYTPGTVATGTLVDSYLVHIDPLREESYRYSGTVTFAEEIVGVIVRWGSMKATTGQFGLTGTRYDARPGHGIEIGRDKIEWSADGHSLRFFGHASPKIDQIRVLTTPIPAPAAILPLAGVGVALSTRKGRVPPKSENPAHRVRRR